MALSEQTPLHSSIPSTGGTFAPTEGLTSQQAAERLAIDGPNALELAGNESFLSILLTQMKNVIFLLTCTAALCLKVLGEKYRPWCLFALVACVGLAKAIGEWSSQDAGEALKKMTASTAKVLRDGEETDVDQEELVVGDVVKLQTGDMVPADMVVLEYLDLQANEALLTGEPTEKRKTTEAPIRTSTSSNDSAASSTFARNMLYKGTAIVQGSGKGEVVATGMRTQVGLIAKRLKGEDHAPLSPLQESVNLVGCIIGCAAVLTVTMTSCLAYALKYSDPKSPCVPDDSNCLLLGAIKRGLLLGVSVIPHGLPFIVTAMLRIGSRRMKADNALLTRQSAVDYIGATSVICTDKTGTLTEGKMTTKKLFGLCATDEARSDVSDLSFYPLRGQSPNGGLFISKDLTPEAMSRMDDMFDSHTHNRQNFAEAEKVLRDVAYQGEEGFEAHLARAHLACGFLTCYGASIRQGDVPGQWETKGNMTETAVKVSAAKAGYFDNEGVGVKLKEAFPRREDVEVPFTSMRKMMATVHQVSQEEKEASLNFIQLPADATHLTILKGAPDKLISSIKQIPQWSNKKVVVPGRPISSSERGLLGKFNKDVAEESLRSLLVAVCALNSNAVEKLRNMRDADTRLTFLLEQPGLCFLSLWGIYDPPRAMVPHSVKECHDAGVRVVMITGDQQDTAVAIGRQVGILTERDSDVHNASDCKKLQIGDGARPDTQRLSRKASQLIASSDLSTQRRQSGADDAAGGAKTETPTLSRRGSRRLSIHDRRSGKDSHEPTYKDEEDLAEIISRVNIWARAQPSDKVAIVECLRKQDHITVMTGDGVNDAPALKHAHTGVAMGISGTAVTQNAASLILMDDDFSTIVSAVREGRRIYSNTQKYLLFNFCLKWSEMSCVLFSIILGLPVPIEGSAQIANLLLTHIVPPLSLAFEPAEPYLMKVPPRETNNDFILTGSMMISRWVPYVIFMAIGTLSSMSYGLWLQTGFFTSRALIGSSLYREFDKGSVACEWAGTLDAQGNFVQDDAPFHCRCQNHWNDMTVDQWGPYDTSEEQVLQKFDKWTGLVTDDLYAQETSGYPAGYAGLLGPCYGKGGVQHWCWSDGMPSKEAGRALLSPKYNCAAYGAKIGSTMAFSCIQLGEVLSLVTFRTVDCFLPHLFTNWWYLLSVVMNAAAWAILVYDPRVSSILEFVPLTRSRVAICVAFPFILIVLCELVKVAYKTKLREQHKELNAAFRKKHRLEPAAIEDAEGPDANPV